MPATHLGKIVLRKRPQKRRAGERAGLSRDKIVVAAAQLLEQTDAKGLTIRALAKMLGVVPTTIKSHFNGGLAEIVSAIARAALAGAARPYKPREEPSDYLGDVYFRILKQLDGRPMTARLVAIELSHDPLLEPFLAERILVCLQELGADARYFPRGLNRVIGRLSDMILVECTQSAPAHRKVRGQNMLKQIAQLPPDEFPMLTENAERLANHAQDPPSGPLNPALAAEYASAAVQQLKVEIAQVPRRRG